MVCGCLLFGVSCWLVGAGGLFGVLCMLVMGLAKWVGLVGTL